MDFKNNIRHMAAVVGNTLLKTFPEVLHHSPGQLRRTGVDFVLDLFLQILNQSRTMFEKTFTLGIPKRKKSHGHFDQARSVYRTLSKKLSQNGCSHNTLQQQSPVVHRSNPLQILKTVVAYQPHDTTPTSLSLIQPAQCPLEIQEIFMPKSVYMSSFALHTLRYKYTYTGRS